MKKQSPVFQWIFFKHTFLKTKTLFSLLILSIFFYSCNRLPSAEQIFSVTGPSQLRLSYNSETTILSDGKYETAFHNKWLNYMDKSHKWKEINPNFIKTERGFEMTKAPFEVVAPFYADQEAVFNNNNRYDIFTNQIIDDKPLEQTIQPLGASHTAGQIETGDLGWGKAQYVVYPNAYPQFHADLIYWVHQGTAPRLRKFIRFNQKLSQNTDFKFRVIYSDAVETVNNGKNVSVKLKDAKNKRGSGWADFYIWDSKSGWTGRKPIRFDFEKPELASVANVTTNPNEYILTKHIDSGYFNTATLPVFTDATSTFYPDPYPENATFDGIVDRDDYTGDTWANVRAAATATSIDNSSTSISVGAQYMSVNNSISIERMILLFNTSGLTSGAIVSSAVLSVMPLSQNVNDLNIVPVSGTTTLSNTSISSADYGTTSSVNSPTEISSRIYQSSMSNGTYVDWTLNANGLAAINKSGITKLAFRNGNYDIDNVKPTSGYRGTNFYSSENSGFTQDPKLVITYTAPPTVTSPTASSITCLGALLGANITSDGGSGITERGTCWGTSPAPAANCVAEGNTSTGIFTQSRTGLPSGTLIYYRGYAINGVGTGYSEDGSFITSTGSAAGLDWNNGNVQEITLTGCRAFTFANGKSGGIYTLLISQDGTGNRTVTWPSNIKWVNGTAPVLTTSGNSTDAIKFVYNGSYYFAILTTLNMK